MRGVVGMEEDATKHKKMKKGIIYIMPCYSCSRYHECLESDEDEVLEHLVDKVALAIIAWDHGLEIVTDKKEWVRKSKELVGCEVKGFVFGLEVEYDDCGKFKNYRSKLPTLYKDGLAIVMVENDKGERKLFINLGEGYTDSAIHENLKEIVRVARVELMETDPKDWKPILEEASKRFIEIARSLKR